MSFLDGFFNQTCYYLERQENTRGGQGGYSYAKSDEKSCKYLEESGYKNKSGQDKQILASQVFLLSEKINEYDRILFNDVEYSIVSPGILIRRSIQNSDIYFYKVYVEKRREYNENEVTINQRVSG